MVLRTMYLPTAASAFPAWPRAQSGDERTFAADDRKPLGTPQLASRVVVCRERNPRPSGPGNRYGVMPQSNEFQVGPWEVGLPVKFTTFGLPRETSFRKNSGISIVFST